MCRALLFRQYVHVDVKIDANLRFVFKVIKIITYEDVDLDIDHVSVLS